MPEHPVLTRRQQFKVKSRIKDEKKSKKGKGKGKGAGKANGKSRGKGKGRKGKKGTKESKEQEGSKAKKKALSSKRVILLNKRKSAAKGTKEEKSSKHDASVEGSEPEKMVKTDQVDVAAAMETEHQKPKVLKKQRNKAGQTAKDKAETRAKASSKTTKRGKNNTETAKRNNSKRNNKKNDSCKTTGKGKDKGKARGKGKGKAGKKAGCTKTVKAVSDELLQGRFNINDLEVDGDLVCPAIKSYFTEIMAECQGCSECDGSVHDLVMPEWDGLHFDMYYKRPAVGIRVRANLVASHAPEKTDQAPSKSAKSIGYFSSGRCMGTNVAMAKIFAS